LRAANGTVTGGVILWKTIGSRRLNVTISRAEWRYFGLI
jgi:hypothetical protein